MTQTSTQGSDDVHELARRLQRLRLARHPMGLRAGAARQFAEDVRSRGDVPEAIRAAGGDLRVASIIQTAKPGDALRLVSGLLTTVGEVAANQRSLQSAAMYPLALLACLALVSVAIYEISVPAIASLAELNGTPVVAARLGGGAGVLICMAMLLLLALATYSRVQVPLLSRGVLMLDRVLVLETVARLHDQGIPLPLALRAAASWVRGAGRREIHELAETLESGGTSLDGGRLLDLATISALLAAAAQGVVSPVLAALIQQARLASRQRIPEEVSRIHIVALVMAGIGLAAVGISFFTTYVTAATG